MQVMGYLGAQLNRIVFDTVLVSGIILSWNSDCNSIGMLPLYLLTTSNIQETTVVVRSYLHSMHHGLMLVCTGSRHLFMTRTDVYEPDVGGKSQLPRVNHVTVRAGNSPIATDSNCEPVAGMEGVCLPDQLPTGVGYNPSTPLTA